MARSNAWRVAAGAAIIVAGGWTIRQLCIVPYRCAAAMTPLQARTFRAAEISATEAGRIMARQNLERLDALGGNCRDDLNWLMLYAANCRIVGDRQGAVEAYTRALRLYQRPEIYYNRGVTLLEMREPDRAIGDLALAANFNPVLLEQFDAATVEQIRKEMARIR